MIEPEPAPVRAAAFSIVIPVYNDWVSLDGCLRSLSEQLSAPPFEVTIVDDGSGEPAPQSILDWGNSYPLSVLRQVHAGISAARNHGIRASKAPLCLFIDADCRLQRDCLDVLQASITGHPGDNCFQLRLIGDCSSLVGRAEELRLITTQRHLLEPDGRIRYLNTAGFAIRRSRVNVEEGLFNTTLLRGEDTLLLANLIESGELPFFAEAAVVQHVVSLSLMECLRKDIRSAYLEGKTYEAIAASGVQIRMGNATRVRMLVSMWEVATRRNIGRRAWWVLVTRQALQRGISVAYRATRSARRLLSPPR